jgi:N-acetylmuramoyl-L-alanine amidase
MKNKKIIMAVLALFALFTMNAFAAYRLTDMRITHKAASSQIIFSVSSSVKPRVFLLPNPERLVVDFSDCRLEMSPVLLHTHTPWINKIRSGAPQKNMVRLVFDLNTAINYTLRVRDDHTIQIDLTKQKAITEFTPAIRPITVVIDPGHGGKDSGAIGPSGIKEKDVVLAIAKQLANMINQQPHMRAVLTRDNDYFISLHDRLVSARRGKADLFVAIHADSYFNKKANGASVYALSQHGATSIAARWLARRDNYSELGGVDLGDLEDQSYLLRSVLIDLAQTNTTQDSMRLGESLLDALDNVTRLHYARVEQAPFMVLKSPDIPSILVETGFISNSKEEKRLADRAYQREIAQALLNGIMRYHKKYATVSMS